MKKRVIVIFGIFVMLFFISFLMYFISAQTSSSPTIESEINKLTHYAEEYETGNIDYAKLVVYAGAVRESLNEIAGVVDKHEGGILNEEQVKKVLGEPSDETKWIWVDGEERERKLDSALPVWEKIIFDGHSIQIRLNAYPSLYSKINYDEERFDDERENENTDDGNDGNENEDDEKIVYRLHFNIDFKKPEEQIDVASKIETIKSLAEKLYAEPTQENEELLAQESVNAEKAFGDSLRQSSLQCENVMNSIFGSEHKRESQHMILQEIEFFEGDDFEVFARLEMCDNCEWHWVNLNFWVEQRTFNQQNQMPQDNNFEAYKGYSIETIKTEIKNSIENIKKYYEQKDFESANREIAKINNLNQAWNEVANDVWPEVNKEYESQYQNQQNNGNNDRYFWIKLEQEKRAKVKERTRNNYEERKQFYDFIFKDYNKKEYSFQQEEWEKMLVQVFREHGEEICDNNVDDNNNQQMDCEEEQCGGKRAGEEKKIVGEGETAHEEIIQLYCIAGERKPKEEIVSEKIPVCGNHICEENEYKDESVIPAELSEEEKEKWKTEHVLCLQDCSQCPVFEAVVCEAEGKVIFSGKDEQGCLLQPVCLEEEKSCTTDEDCKDISLCGVGICVDNFCKVEELSECREQECNNGEGKIQHCKNGEQLVVEICKEGLWHETGLACLEITEPGEIEEKEVEGDEGEILEVEETEREIGETEVISIERIAGTSCITQGDCGNENDVCSNGHCVALPEIREDEREEIIENEITDGEIENGISLEKSFREQENELENKPDGDEINDEIETERVGETIERETDGTNIIGNVIKYITQPDDYFFTITGKITSRITGFDTDENDNNNNGNSGEINGGNQVNENGDNQNNGENNNEKRENNEQSEEERRREEEQRRQEDDERREREDSERGEREHQEKTERCENDCKNRCEEIFVRCVEQRVFVEGSQEMNDLEQSKLQCQDEKKEEYTQCINSCSDACVKGEDFQPALEQREHKEQLAGFRAGGSCRIAQNRKESNIFFDGWGEAFKNFHVLKNKYYQGDNSDWCRWDVENLLKQRKEFEKSFNQAFAQWFFEQYLANAADNWEERVSGIYELYWKNVDIQQQLASRMKCLGKKGITEIYSPQLITFKYETNYGSIEYWEELKKVKLDEKGNLGSSGEEVEIITPYMKIWIFPNKEFIKSEMKQAMQNHEFPGGSDEDGKKESGGPSETEKMFLRQDKEFMEQIREISKQYDNGFEGAMQLVDENNIVFNVLVKINERDILSLQPLFPEENPAVDVTAQISFEKMYELIEIGEKDMRGARVESPPWDRKLHVGEKINEVVNGIEMYFKIRGLISDAEVYPEEHESDVKKLAREFLQMMIFNDKPDENREDKENRNDEEFGGEFENQDENAERDDEFDEKFREEFDEEITGEIVSSDSFIKNER